MNTIDLLKYIRMYHCYGTEHDDCVLWAALKGPRATHDWLLGTTSKAAARKLEERRPGQVRWIGHTYTINECPICKWNWLEDGDKEYGEKVCKECSNKEIPKTILTLTRDKKGCFYLHSGDIPIDEQVIADNVIKNPTMNYYESNGVDVCEIMQAYYKADVNKK